MVGGVVVLVGLGIENTMVSIPSFVNTYELRKCYLRTYAHLVRSGVKWCEHPVGRNTYLWSDTWLDYYYYHFIIIIHVPSTHMQIVTILYTKMFGNENEQKSTKWAKEINAFPTASPNRFSRRYFVHVFPTITKREDVSVCLQRLSR